MTVPQGGNEIATRGQSLLQPLWFTPRCPAICVAARKSNAGSAVGTSGDAGFLGTTWTWPEAARQRSKLA
jgi:hypothetical protein